MNISRLAYALASLGGVIAATSGPAYAVGTGLPFTVTEGVIPQTAPGGTLTDPNTFNADSLDFSYKAQVTGGDVSGGGSTPFNESGFFEASSYKLGASTQASFMNSPGANGYGMYGVFTLQGAASLTGATEITAIFSTGTLDIYLDTARNTTKTLGATGSDPTTLGNIGDDLKVGSASLVGAGEAHVFIGLASGDFEVIWGDWALTSFGSTYWSDPSPFYMVVDVNGNNTNISPPPSATGGTSTFDGSGNAFFVPEPDTIACLGLTLAMIGFLNARRRKLVPAA